MTEMDLRQKVVRTITGWKGAKQGGAVHREIINIYNGHKPLARGVKMTTSYAWCAATASAAYIAAGVADYTGTECSCTAWIELAKKLGIWVERDNYVPKLGDAIIYDWQDDSKNFIATDNKGAPDHVGIVTGVGMGAFTVTEGNKGNPSQVADRPMQVNGRFIRGFIAPDFARAARELSGGAAAAAIDKLAKLGVINSPEYWKEVVDSGKVKYLDALFNKAAAKISKTGARSSTVENGVAALVAGGVINTPDYWLNAAAQVPNVSALLQALGGAVRAS